MNYVYTKDVKLTATGSTAEIRAENTSASTRGRLKWPIAPTAAAIYNDGPIKNFKYICTYVFSYSTTEIKKIISLTYQLGSN